MRERPVPPHGGDTYELRRWLPGADILDFSANINPLGMPWAVRDAFADSLADSESYPDPACRNLRRALAAVEGVDGDRIVCGAGASDLIWRIARALRPKTALLPAPTFSEYERALAQTGCRCTHHLLREAGGFALEESFARQIPGHEVVFVCNPNNPTGRAVGPDTMGDILRVCKAAGCVLIVDECFLDFLPDGQRVSMKEHLESCEGLIVLRAFTKSFAMPGLRLGYALCADPRLPGRIAAAGPDWSVSVPAQRCGMVAAGQAEHLERTRSLVARERARLEQALRALGLRVYPGSANYILFYTPDSALGRRLRRRGILIRDCSNFRGLGPGFYRIAVRLPQQNNALIRALKECGE